MLLTCLLMVIVFTSLAIQLGRPLAAHDVRTEIVEYLRNHPNVVSQTSVATVLGLIACFQRQLSK